jgi:hypothetical protein
MNVSIWEKMVNLLIKRTSAVTEENNGNLATASKRKTLASKI